MCIIIIIIFVYVVLYYKKCENVSDSLEMSVVTSSIELCITITTDIRTFVTGDEKLLTINNVEQPVTSLNCMILT